MSQRPPQKLELAKLQTLRDMARSDAVDPIVVNLAARLARPHKPDDWKGIAEEVHHFVRDGIRFQRDPDRREEFASSAVVIQRGWDDCDGKAKLAVALLRALGMDADVWPIWNDEGELAHVQYIVRWPGSVRYPGHRNGWVTGEPNLDASGAIRAETTVAGVELGVNPYTMRRNPETGKLPLAGGH